MAKQNVNWFKHLQYAVPVEGYGNKLSMYFIALEAWRRGITINFFNIDNMDNKVLVRYSLNFKGRESKFEGSKGDKLSNEADKICENKDETKRYLTKAGVSVPEGKRFEVICSITEILSYAKRMGYPVVLKPTNLNAGKGVFSNINSEEELKESLIHVRDDLNYQDVIVEKYIPGVEYRILLINGEVIGAVNRIPANVTGNGKKTIEELITLKNKEKKINPNLSKKTIKIDKEVLNSIQSLGYQLESIPKDGERIFLRSKSNVSTGGDPIDVTDQLTNELRDMASRASQAVPGLDICGLDMIVDKENNSGVIIEINTKPMLGLHLFPMEGEARDVIKPIIDYYFPETINSRKTNLYFDFDSLLAPLNNISTKQLKVLPPPSLEKTYGKKYIVYGEITGVGYKAWVRKKALQYQLHGYTKRIEYGKTMVVVASTDKDKVDNFKDICYQGPADAKVNKVEEYPWEKPVKIGFEIQRESKAELKAALNSEKKSNNKLKKQKQEVEDRIESLNQDISRLKREKETFKRQKVKIKKEKDNVVKEKKKLEEEKKDAVQEIKFFEQKYLTIQKSRSWRITKPLRKITSLINRKR
ncbi:D-alanine-D-alanine ligase-like ATP-grasp enzyme/acylphosphatase [Virgibacillus natechei]|uniref:Acylphosphatase n=1 Tax=Virgibacillus natechei TaxID=1216297 RepID=A0ABS4IKP9_9BACI|nr:acylphosphatase [Virgibacillus natechei]MBP1971475.1 D-alanine-D-alanine ligase-like ATP-grasp enzyme/acylphosphatase [Virgibacillus natechei]UZD12529.1 acylphosphatase [Virgibacillus natechei]